MSDELLTILFTDVEGSTALHAAKGDIEARRILGACDEVVREQVREHGGREIKAIGDGFMISFTSPRKAVACALAIQEAATRGQQVRVRAGLHTGEVSEEGGDLFGGAVNAAARICAKAQGGEVLVSDVVRQLCGTSGDVAWHERGLQRLRGFPERWRLYRAMPQVQGTRLGERTPFVGRERELRELSHLMEQALAGHGGLVMIGGEPGVGKTRLSEEMGAEGLRHGFRVFTGHCYESGRDLPYMPWVELIETAARETTSDVFREMLGEDAPEVARIVPALRRRFPDVPSPLELPADQQRRYIFNGVRNVVARAAAVQPRLYVLEDLHWADEATLLLLEHIAERVPTMPVVIIGTYRDPPIDVSPQLAESLSSMVRRREARLLSLRRHSEVEVEALLRALSGQAPPSAVRTAIYGETEGNAFFVEEVFRHLAESGRLLDERGRFRDDVDVGELDVPANVRLVTGRRLERLSDATQRVLSIAAVAGRHIGFELLEAIAEVQGDLLIDALDEAERARLVITETTGRAEEYWFAHELIRQTLLAGLPAARRRGHHLRVADALVSLHPDDVPAHAPAIAQHLLQAGAAADRVQTAHYLTLAGDRARAAVASEEALRHYGNALSILPSDDLRARADLLVKVGVAQRSLARWDETVATWEQALTALEALGDVEAIGALCFEFGLQLCWGVRFSEALAVTQRGLTAIEGRSGPARARLLAIHGIALSQAGTLEGAATAVKEAQTLAAAHGDPRLLATVDWVATYHHYACMRLLDASEAGERAAERARKTGAHWDLAQILAFLDVAYTFRGRFRESDELHAELLPIAERLGHWLAAALARRNRFPKLAAQRGDLAMLDAFSANELKAAGELELSRHWVGHATAMRGLVEFWRGRWAEARQYLEEGASLALPGLWHGIQHGFLLVLTALIGARQEAYDLLELLRGAFPEPRRANMIGQWNLAALAAEAVGILGDAERARALYPLVVEAMATGTVMRQYDGALIQRAAGMAAAAAGLHDEAERHFEKALSQAQALPHLMERPQVRQWYGRFLMERGGTGDRDHAQTLLEEAVTGYHAVGMPRHEAMAHELLVEIDAGRVRG